MSKKHQVTKIGNLARTIDMASRRLNEYEVGKKLHKLKDKLEKFSWLEKLILIAVLAYVIMPIDMIPDFTPVIGYMDDIAILMAALASINESFGMREKEY